MIQTKELVVTTLIAAIGAIMITPSIAHAQSPAHAGEVNSNVRNDPGQDVIVIHWDEDFNNLSLGIDHHGEVVPVQIPHNLHP